MLNILLVFFAIPLATIILSAILETFINSPLKVVGIFFSIFIVVAFALGGTAELILAALVYTIISFLTALIIHKIKCRNNIDTINVENGYTDCFSNCTNDLNTTQVEDNTVSTSSSIYNNSRCRRYN